jgi:hypothetical protein
MHIRKNSLNFFRYKPRKWQKTCTFDIFLSPKHAFFHTFSFFLPFSMTLPPDNKKLKNSLICLVMCSLLCIFAFEHWHTNLSGGPVRHCGLIYSVCCLIDIPKFGRRRSPSRTCRRSRYAWTLLVFSEGLGQTPGMWMSSRPRFLCLVISLLNESNA